MITEGYQGSAVNLNPVHLLITVKIGNDTRIGPQNALLHVLNTLNRNVVNVCGALLLVIIEIIV
jgi:hypothetical protein